jgi:SagB-type dehydrogenase domain
MKNPTSTVGLKYTQATFYGLRELMAEGHGEEGQPGEPLRFKIYQDLHYYPLNQQLPLTLGDARWSFETYRRASSLTRPVAASVDQSLLSSLFFYSYGFSRHDTGTDVRWPFHRFVPSARCLFPEELYLWTPGDDALPEGFYHYDCLHQALAALRQGSYRHTLSQVLGYKLDASDVVLFVSSYFWKNAFRYRNFAYRLCSQEAGMLIGNILAVAGTLGVQASVVYQFLDRPLERLLGLESVDESPFAAVIISTQERPLSAYQIAQPISSAEILPHIDAIAPQHIQLSVLDCEKCAKVIEIDQASQYESTREFCHAMVPTAAWADQEDAPVASAPLASAPLSQQLDLAQVLYQRNSGDVLFTPLKRTIGQDVFWEVIQYSLDPYMYDLQTQGAARPMIDLYVAVNDVAGIENGVYRFCPSSHTLQVIELGDVSDRIRQIHSTPSVNCTTANMVCYAVANYYPLDEALGARAYRIMNMECGLVAQRLCIMSSALGLAARCSDSYHIELCEQLLHLTAEQAMPIYLIAIGYERPEGGFRYRHAIRF